MISSFRAPGNYRRCRVLVSDSPLGPFLPAGKEPVTPDGWHCLDGTLYADRRGKPWLVFCHEWLQVGDGQVCAVPLSGDLKEAAGEPVVLFRASDGPWTGQSGVTDGPFLHRLPGGKLMMLYPGRSLRHWRGAQRFRGDIRSLDPGKDAAVCPGRGTCHAFPCLFRQADDGLPLP